MKSWLDFHIFVLNCFGLGVNEEKVHVTNSLMANSVIKLIAMLLILISLVFTFFIVINIIK